MSLITIVTPTGGRPEAMKLCHYYMERQTYKGDIEWLIVDDELISEKIEKIANSRNIFIPGPQKYKPGFNTQRPNLDAAIKHVHGDYIFIVENDDWYSPKYIESTLALLQLVDVVGEGNTKYYNLKYSCYKELQNFAHSSLCQTAFRRSALPIFEQAVNSGKEFIDLEFWRLARNKMIYTEANLCIGIKGMPGRPGIGLGHSPQGFINDTNMAKLISWIGEADAKAYAPYYNGPKPLTAGQSAIVHGVKEALASELNKRDVSVRGKGNGAGHPSAPAPGIRR